MSDYTDARSQPGKKGAGGSDDRELYLREFGEMTIEAWDETFDFKDATYSKTISRGKSETFPIIGRKRDAVEHVPGEEVLGGTIEHDEVEISLDGILIESAFIAEIDEHLVHYDLGAPYARQIGESIASTENQRIGSLLVKASRVTTPPYTGGPVPSYHYHADMRTDPSHLEEAAFLGIEHIRKNDIGGGQSRYWLPWKQQLLLARYTGIDTEETSGSGDRSAGTVGRIAGLEVKGTNSVPSTNITTGRAKYQGDFTTTVGVIANQMAVGTLNKRGLRVVMDEQKRRLGTLMLGSKFAGHGILRPECSFEVADTVRS
ncbi:MAG: hypothetical protein JJ891_06870 [Rhizobiaceae bacterium]|nr:hypothetical protein [Rhizobiaceae bacterium]